MVMATDTDMGTATDMEADTPTEADTSMKIKRRRKRNPMEIKSDSK